MSVLLAFTELSICGRYPILLTKVIHLQMSILRQERSQIIIASHCLPHNDIDWPDWNITKRSTTLPEKKR